MIPQTVKFFSFDFNLTHLFNPQQFYSDILAENSC
jgi:hypothetical protein